jgi:hypothetical protein
MIANPVDVWDAHTFDSELMDVLENEVDLIRKFFETERQIFLSYDLGRGPRNTIVRPQNPHARAFNAFQESMSGEMQRRIIRAFHYTRLTDREVETINRKGVHLSTPETLRRRLDGLIAAGQLTRNAAEQIYAGSPFQGDQLQVRSDKFWMTSHPVSVDDGGVEYLLAYWGGEVASMWISDDGLRSLLASLGKPRIIEIAVPMSSTRHALGAGQAVVATFARLHGAITDKRAFDVYVERSLPPAVVLAVHTEGDVPFVGMGRGYRSTYIDMDSNDGGD